MQLAARAGARVIVTASSAERIDRLKAFGADAGINYRTLDIAGRALLQRGGCDLAIDLVGGSSTGQVLRSVRDGGRVSVVGAASGAASTADYGTIIMKRLSINGVLFGADMHTPRAHDLISGMFYDVAEGRLRLPIAGTYPLAEGRGAHAYAETGHPFGRVIIRP